MRRKTKTLVTDISSGVTNNISANIKFRNTFFRKTKIELNNIEHAREYISMYWQKLERFHPKDDESLVGLPYPYLVPAHEEGHEFDFNELYYWDSYFMVQGILDAEHKQLVMGILEDLIYLFNRFRVIPNASRTYLTGRSQPPFLTSFIFDVYDAYDLDKNWLKEKMKVAEEEYAEVWLGTTKPNVRQVFAGLSRYYDPNYIHDLAEAESGWDMTTRFNRKCLDYLPIDLNSLLYKYETDFAKFYDIMNDKKTADMWRDIAKKRQNEIDKLMWSSVKGLFFDFNYRKEKKGSVASLAAYYPMWAGLASKRQAKLLVKALKRFEQKGGLSTTDLQPIKSIKPTGVPVQWSYPNGWAPLHFMVVKGLQRYGYHDDAKRIASKWLKTNLDWFLTHGEFLEKYNVVSPGRPPLKGLYPSLTGFGWTNSVFERFCQEFLN